MQQQGEQPIASGGLQFLRHHRRRVGKCDHRQAREGGFDAEVHPSSTAAAKEAQAQAVQATAGPSSPAAICPATGAAASGSKTGSGKACGQAACPAARVLRLFRQALPG